MNSTRQVVSLSKVFARHLHKSKPLSFTEEAMAAKAEKLAKMQQKFQIDDGTPVYLKGGRSDKLLLSLTCGLLIVGIGMSGDVIYKLLNKN